MLIEHCFALLISKFAAQSIQHSHKGHEIQHFVAFQIQKFEHIG